MSLLEKIDFDGGVTNRSRASFEACSCGSGTRKRSITRRNAPIVRGEKGRRTAEPTLSLFTFSPLLFERENAQPRSSFSSRYVYTPTRSRPGSPIKMTKGEVDHPLTPSSTSLFVVLFESPSQKIRFSEDRFLFRHTTRERNGSWDGRRRPSSSERLNVAGIVSFLAPITSNARNCRLSRSSSSNRRRSVFSNGATGNKAAESSFVSLRFRPA